MRLIHDKLITTIIHGLRWCTKQAILYQALQFNLYFQVGINTRGSYEKKKKYISYISTGYIYIYIYIKQIEDQVIKAQRLSKFHKTLVRETCKPELRIQEPKVDLEKIYNRFTKSKKEVTVNDLQKEIKETKFEVRSLKQELTILLQGLL